VTGGTVNNTSLIKDDDSGAPQTGGDAKTRLPMIGAIVTALLPMALCAAAVYWVSRYFGSTIVDAVNQAPFEEKLLPTSISAFFVALRGVIALVEHLVAVVRQSNWHDWHTLLFYYLVICLIVRMSPLTGNVRGSLGAIALLGLAAFFIGRSTDSGTGPLASAWPLIVFSVAVLMALLVLSLLVTGAVVLVRTLTGHAGPAHRSSR
jgi:hypothetical protein